MNLGHVMPEQMEPSMSYSVTAYLKRVKSEVGSCGSLCFATVFSPAGLFEVSYVLNYHYMHLETVLRFRMKECWTPYMLTESQQAALLVSDRQVVFLSNPMM